MSESTVVAIKRSVFNLLLVASLAGCAAQPSVDVFVTRLYPVESTMLEQRTRIDLRLQNLGRDGFRARGVAVQLELNGSRFAQGVSNEPFDVPALGETTTSVVLSTSVFDVIRQLLSLDGKQTFAYELKGRVYSGSVGYRFRRTGEFDRKQLEALGRSRR